jgi:peptide deformylase
MSVLKIYSYPTQILQAKSQKVEFPLSAQTKNLIRDMWETVEDKGVGLAAPQVNESLQICIICLDPEMLPKNQKIKNNFVLINPEIVFYSQVECKIIEGCLSFPSEYYEIQRPQNIVVNYQDEKGKLQQIKASGWLSRVIQHEVDHLNGELFINKGGRKIEPEKVDKSKIVD